MLVTVPLIVCGATVRNATSSCGSWRFAHSGAMCTPVTVQRPYGACVPSAPGTNTIPAPVPETQWAAVISVSAPGLSTTLAVHSCTVAVEQAYSGPISGTPRDGDDAGIVLA